ncbi:hypothetical protein UCRPA7_1960 [Phaeoacremonium minimum UCRPA7]|uniref:Uncharacterized protein n=1 Tax=Phaeoacremonium minimum (strain UCR-PA7) TaxID=1286976 RepID=R8BTI1_PHAM7|nr:hypothetical protein UCRPA7_1960 [Phaeoacremonium minimum UCRPA7]EOO02585.1 hypothetical protein UCRPA7_1960 [Phaeoacremonium minimum UCRPA7]
MGAQQSSEGSATAGDAVPRKTCYYEVLGVDSHAADEDIRRAYKRKALELHPDRNINDVENATRKFAEVQTAYEILSDPQERAWYDSHRDAVLRGDVDADDAPQQHYNVRLTTTEEIMTLIGRFNSSVPFNDTPTGFFGSLDITFGQLATEEAAACDWQGTEPVEYPPFGSADDSYESVARPFYNAWSNFSTKKSFSWKDKYRLSDAPDRRVRRLMEKENKKYRDDAIRDFNDAVRSLVAFVKKRDPRYIPNTQSEADRQKILRDSAAAQAARSRAAHQEKIAEAFVPDWAQSRHDADANDEFASTEEESEVEHIECVVCNKTFKSEKQFEAHEKSKKHLKAVQELRRQMKKENMAFDLDHQTSPGPADDDPPPEPGISGGAKRPETSAPESIMNGNAETTVDGSGSPSEEESIDEDYAPRSVIENRILTASPGSQVDSPATDGDLESHMAEATLDELASVKKVGKAKAKREKKAARQAAQVEDASHTCGICLAQFESKTKLFKHIREEGHAQPQVVQRSTKGGKKSKK